MLLPRRGFPLGIFWGIANRLDGSRADRRDERAVGDQPGGAEVKEESSCRLQLPSGRLERGQSQSSVRGTQGQDER